MPKLRCPDCKHSVDLHDMYGCVMYDCRRYPKLDACTLTQEFLLEYFAEENP